MMEERRIVWDEIKTETKVFRIVRDTTTYNIDNLYIGLIAKVIPRVQCLPYSKVEEVQARSFPCDYFDNIKLDKDTTYIEKLVRIEPCEGRKLKTKVILMVKVIWQ